MLNAHTCTPIIYPSASHTEDRQFRERPCPAPIPGCPAWTTPATHKAGKTMPCPHSRVPSMDHISNTQSRKDHALPPFQGAQHGSHQQHTKPERPCPAPIPGCPAWITSATYKAGKTMPCPHSRVPSMDHISNTQSWKDHALPPFQGAQHGSHQPHGDTHNTKTARGTKVNKLVDTQISRDKVVGTASLHTSCKWHGSMRRCCLVVAGGTSSCPLLSTTGSHHLSQRLS